MPLLQQYTGRRRILTHVRVHGRWWKRHWVRCPVQVRNWRLCHTWYQVLPGPEYRTSCVKGCDRCFPCQQKIYINVISKDIQLVLTFCWHYSLPLSQTLVRYVCGTSHWRTKNLWKSVNTNSYWQAAKCSYWSSSHFPSRLFPSHLGM